MPVLLIPVAIATGVIDTGGKFVAGIIVDTCGNLPKVSITPAELVAKFAAGVVDSFIFRDLVEDDS
jgi:hypothetical protein